MTLQNFPRGGKKPYGKSQHSESLFDNKIKHAKNKKSRKRKIPEDFEEDSNFTATSATRLTHAALQEGLVVLGRISEIIEYELIVSLPGALKGRVLATDISQSYTSLLQNIIKQENDMPTEYKSLSELYNVGDYVVCYVTSGDPDDHWHVNLSLKPSLINQNVDKNYLTNCTKLVCTITSIEDHGYLVETGIPNTRAFIAFKQVDSGKQYFPGKQLMTVIKDIKSEDNTSIIKLSVKEKKVDRLSTHEVQSLNNLTPGTMIDLQVKRVLSNGLHVTFGENYTGYINQIYLENSLSSYTEEMEITGTLLYVEPTTKFSYFTTLTHQPEALAFQPGDIIKHARILFRDSKGIIIDLDSGLRGIVSFRRIGVDIEQVDTKFKSGTRHKCRVLAYNSMDRLYICTMERDILGLKHFSCADFIPGEIVNAEIVHINQDVGYVIISVGKVSGYVSPEHVSDVGRNGLSKLTVGQQVRARVLVIKIEEKKVHLTLKESLINSNLPVLYEISQAKCGSLHHGTIVKLLKHGALVRFFGNVKGIASYPASNENALSLNKNFSVGQTILVRIDSVDMNTEKMKLRIEMSEDIIELRHGFSIGECVEGVVTDCSAEGVYLRIDKGDTYAETGFLPAGHMAPCPDVAALLASKCLPGDVMTALVFSTMPQLLLTRTFVSQEQYRSFDNLKIGDSIPCSIRDILDDGLRVILPINDYDTFGFIHLNNVTNFDSIKPNQILFVKIIDIDKKGRQLKLTASLNKILASNQERNTNMMMAVDSITLYFNKLTELAAKPYYKGRLISAAKLGQRVTGRVTKITEYGLVLMLDNGLEATVRKDNYKGNYKVGDNVSGVILWVNYIHEYVDVILIRERMQRINSKQSKLPELPVDTVLRGEILMVTNWFVLIHLKGEAKGSLAVLPARRHINDIEPNLKPYVTGAKLRCYTVLNRNESEILPICMLKSAFEISETLPEATNDKKARKRKNKPLMSEGQVPAKKQKVKHADTSVNSEENTKQVKPLLDDNTNRKIKKGEPYIVENGTRRTKKSAKENESLLGTVEEKKDIRMKDKGRSNIKSKEPAKSAEQISLPECGFFWDERGDLNMQKESSSDSESEAETKSEQKKTKKLNAAERRELARQKEREIREREEYLASNQMPNSVDQFDRLVLSSPDSSLIWLQYMAFHLQATEIEKARAVVRRAVKTINFREENERLNVWNAWLNLESKFGTSETLQDVFQEAVRTNDALKVYMHMLTVHVDAGREVELEKLISTMLGKFKQDPQVWVECGNALLKLGLKDRSRHIMQRALQSLPASNHVNVMVRFAQLENKFGDKERAQTLFDQILSSYPKRVDVWCSYVDALIKSSDIEIARKVLERSVVQTLPPRKMKTLFKKFISFEEQHGTPEGVAHVKQMAVEFVENQCRRESV